VYKVNWWHIETFCESLDKHEECKVNTEHKRMLVEHYINAYNNFDIETMMEVLHPDITFENITEGQINDSASGKEEFRALAEQAKSLFISRTQTIANIVGYLDPMEVDIYFVGTLAMDLEDGAQAGETLSLTGCSKFTFKDGKIFGIREIS
jgi:ketosteroid isomerase-like protein